MSILPQENPAPSTPPLDLVMDKVEEELARLRRKRPHLELHIERAEQILVSHFAFRGKPNHQIIRVRIGLGGRPKFLFRSLRERGATYVINPSFWQCSCPSYHRRGAPCKHSLAAFVLWRAAQPEVKRGVSCAGCDQRFPRREMFEMVEGNHDNLSYFNGDLLCRSCCDRAGVSR